jgi:hypothetical protein
MRHLILFLCFFLPGASAWAVGNLARVELINQATGRVLPVYKSDGRWFVAGNPGSEYRIVIRNRSGGDLLAVASMDGVNVVSGETAAPSQSGYVIGRHGSLSIAGWRKSLEKVAAFFFTDLGNAYAVRTGRPDNVGVIGVALFRRKAEPVADLDEPAFKAEGGASRGSADASAPRAAEKSIGTGHGRQQTSHARYVEFERESDLPSEIIAIHYDTRANLVARGVIREREKWPAPFPGEFVPDPPGRG